MYRTGTALVASALALITTTAASTAHAGTPTPLDARVIVHPHTPVLTGVGTTPRGIAVDQSTGTVWVADSGGDQVSRLTGTLAGGYTVTNSTVGSEPLAVGVNSTTHTAYSADYGDDTVATITAAGGVTIGLPTAANPNSVAVDSTTGQYFVGINPTPGLTGKVQEYTSDGAVGYTASPGVAVTAVAVDPSRNVGYVTVAGANLSAAGTVCPFTLTSGALGTCTTVGDDPVAVAVDSDSGDVYVANFLSNSVTEIAGASVTTFDLSAHGGTGPDAIAVAPGGTVIDVADYSSNSLSEIYDGSVLAAVTTASGPDGIALDATRNIVYISAGTANDVEAIPGLAGQTTTTLTAQFPSASTVAADTLTATVSPATATGTVTFLNASTDAALTSPITVTGGVAAYPVIFPATGSIPVVAVFTPANATFDASTSTSRTVAVSDPPGGFAALAPQRILDTGHGIGTSATSLPAGQVLPLTVAGHGGIPSGFTGTVALTVTVAAPTTSGAGYLAVYPDGSARPSTSVIDFGPAVTVPNMVLVKVASDGKIDIFNGAKTGAIRVVADVDGLFFAGTATGGYLTPLATSLRLLDTRHGIGAPQAPIAAGHSVTIHVAGVDGLPATLSGAAINLIAVSPTSSGTLVASGAPGGAVPGVTALSFAPSAQSPATAAMDVVSVSSSASGTVTITNTSSKPVEIVADLFGYWTPGSGAGSLVPSVPATRLATLTVPAQASVTAALPANDAGAALSVSAVAPSESGYLTIYPATYTQPNASNVNFVPAVSSTNLTLVPPDGAGNVRIYNSARTAVHVTVDVDGGFAGSA